MTCGSRSFAFASPWGNFFVSRGWRGWSGGGFGAFGPLGAKRRFFESGEVRLAILSLLADGPKHGYELIKQLEARSGGLYRASAGTVYPTLQLLEDEGMIVSETSDGKRVYRITDEGRKELERESETVDEIWSRAGRWNEWSEWLGPQAVAIAGPLAHVVKSALKAVHEAGDSADKQDRVREILERARKDLEDATRTKKGDRKE
jgi:DNA-binding PadR family transcriptional regulator